MEIKRIIVGQLETNCYLIYVGQEAIVVDPGDDLEKILDEIKKNNLNVKMIILTHYHFDHANAALKLKEKTGAKILIHEKDANFLDFKAGRYLKEGYKIKIGNEDLKVIHSPGHSKGSICLLGKHEIFVGDLIFENGRGRTDLPGGSEEEIQQSLKKIYKIFKPGMLIYPGHGEVFTILSET